MQVAILGGGISGLVAAYYLAQKFNIILLEKKKHTGGWLGSSDLGGFFFEKGPRTLRITRESALFQLLQELGLDNKLLFAAQEARRRYLWIDGKMRKITGLNFALIQELCREWWQPVLDSDESVWDFACRRFGITTARRFFDPLSTGIYAGDIHRLSIEACFPILKNWERNFGSVGKGLYKTDRKKWLPLFSLPGGLQHIVDVLTSQLKQFIRYEQEVLTVQFTRQGVMIHTQHETLRVDRVFCALPCKEAGRLFCKELAEQEMSDITMVHLGYLRHVISTPAFGYLVSSFENSGVLGVIFDSCAFPQFNHHHAETRLTVMLRGLYIQKEQAIELALCALKKHLNIVCLPDMVTVVPAPNALPHMTVGFSQRMATIEQNLQKHHPTLTLVGNYLSGVSVGDCIARAKSSVDNFFKQEAN